MILKVNMGLITDKTHFAYGLITVTGQVAIIQMVLNT